MLNSTQRLERARWKALSPESRKATVAKLNLYGSEKEKLQFRHAWHLHARDSQVSIDNKIPVTLICAGRGFGKSLALVEYALNEISLNNRKEILLVGETPHKVIDAFVKSPSGFLARAHPDLGANLVGNIIHFSNGARIILKSGAHPENIRGYNAQLTLVDEMVAFAKPDNTWDQIQLATRIAAADGSPAKIVIATTPKPTKLFKRLTSDKDIQVVRGSTYENTALPAEYIERMRKIYGNSRLGRQELYGEVIEDNVGALWSYDEIARMYRSPAKDTVWTQRILAVDPSMDGKDECGIVLLGKDDAGIITVLRDYSSPDTVNRWTDIIADLWRGGDIDKVVLESNNGGAALVGLLQQKCPNICTASIHSSVSKLKRAEPVKLLANAGEVVLADRFQILEEQMTSFTGSGPSPDRLDAMVIGVNYLRAAASPVPTIDAFQIFNRRGTYGKSRP